MGRVELQDPWWANIFSIWLAIELRLLKSVGVPISDREKRSAGRHYEKIVAPHRRLRLSR